MNACVLVVLLALLSSSVHGAFISRSDYSRIKVWLEATQSAHHRAVRAVEDRTADELSRSLNEMRAPLKSQKALYEKARRTIKVRTDALYAAHGGQHPKWWSDRDARLLNSYHQEAADITAAEQTIDTMLARINKTRDRLRQFKMRQEDPMATQADFYASTVADLGDWLGRYESQVARLGNYL